MVAWLLLTSAVLEPPARSSVPVQQVHPKLEGLTPAEASSLIAKLQQAQSWLKARKSETFELLAGAPASYPAAEVAPRTAFLHMSFAQPWSIERKPATGLWQPYELVYFPPGPHILMWKVTVTIGQVGELERVEMLYTAPPPF